MQRKTTLESNMNDKQTFSFPLQRDGETLGMIHWQDGSAEISGDAAEVAAFEEAIQGAIATKYMDSYPAPGLVIIDARPTDIREMISVLDFGGFTIPDCFADYTAAARAKRASERNDFFTRLGSRVRKLY